LKLVKIGGSVITDKKRLYQLKREVLERLAGEIATSKEKVVLVHGAGSFGHVVAHYFQLSNGRGSKRPPLPAELEEILPRGEATSQAWGMARVHRDVQQLNLEVIDALGRHHLPAVGIAPSMLFRRNQGKLEPAENVRIFRDLFQDGFLPVTFGDGVWDDQQTYSICSGDHLMVLLAQNLKFEEVIFVTDVDGVFTGTPDDPESELMEAVGEEQVVSLQKGSSGVQDGVFDVTNGIWGKLSSSFEIAKLGLPVWFVNGLEPGRLQGRLEGKSVLGSRINPF